MDSDMNVAEGGVGTPSAAEDDPSIVSCHLSLPPLSADECSSPWGASARVRSWLGVNRVGGGSADCLADMFRSVTNRAPEFSACDSDDEASVFGNSSDQRPARRSLSSRSTCPGAGSSAIASNRAETKAATSIQPIGIFWDIENCQVPRRCNASTFVALIRAQFVTDQCWEAEFVCACDASKASSFTLTQLNDAQVDVLHVPATSKNAADDKLKQCLRRFGDQHQPPATVLIITGDMNFAPDLNFLRLRKKFRVLLVHNRHARPALLHCCDQAVLLDDLVQDVDSDQQVDGEDRRCRHLCITDLPPLSAYITAQRLRNELRRLIDNCGGKLARLNCDDHSAVLAFSTADSAARAKYRLHGAIVCGHQTYVRFYYHPHYHHHHHYQPQQSEDVHHHHYRYSPTKADRTRRRAFLHSGGMSEQSGSDQACEPMPSVRSLCESPLTSAGAPLVGVPSSASPEDGAVTVQDLPLPVPSSGINSFRQLPTAPSAGSLQNQQRQRMKRVGVVDERSSEDRKLMPPPPAPPQNGNFPVKSTVSLTAASCVSADEAVSPAFDGAGGGVPDAIGSRVPDGTGGRVSDPTGGRVPDGTGCRVPDPTGGRFPDGTGCRVPDPTGGRVLDAIGGRVPDPTGGRVSDGAGGGVPDATVGRVPDGTGGGVPDAIGGRLPDATGGRVPDGPGGRGPVKLIVSNLDPSKSHSHLQQILIDKVADSAKLVNVSVSSMLDGSVSAQLTVTSQLEAQAVIAQLHRASIGTRRISVAYSSQDRPQSQLVQRQVVAVLTSVPLSKLPLVTFMQLYQQRFHSNISVSDMFRMRDTVVVSDSPIGRTVCLSQRLRRHLRHSSNGQYVTPSAGNSGVTGRCSLHSSTCPTPYPPPAGGGGQEARWSASGSGQNVGWAECEYSNILPCSEISSDRLQSVLHRLLHAHNGQVYLSSFLDCYIAVTGDSNLVSLSLNADAVCLEQLISNLPQIAIVQQNQHKLIVWRQQPPHTEPVNVNPLLHERVQAFCRKVTDLLKVSYRARLPFSRFIPAYHHHFGQQCRVSDYGFTRLSDLFDTLPHLVQIIGSGQRRQITLTYLAQQRRFLADLMRVLKCQQCKQLPLEALFSAFARVQGSALCVWDYGVTSLLELLNKVCGDNVVMYKQNGETFVAIPRREQTSEEIQRTRHFSVEVQELLKRLPHYRVQFNRFIPAYHHHFGRQCRVTDYGFNKLAELFEVISDVVKFSTDEDGEKMVQLTHHALMNVLSQQLVEIFTENPSLTMTGVSVDRLSALFTHKFGFRLDPGFFGCSSLLQLFGSLRCSLRILNHNMVNLVDQQKVKCVSARVRHILMSSPTGSMSQAVFLTEYESRFGHIADVGVIKDHMKHLVQITEPASAGQNTTFRLWPLQLVARDVVSVLRSHGNQPIALASFADTYLATLGVVLSPAKFGCHSVAALLEAMPETVQLIDTGYKRSVCLVPELVSLNSPIDGATNHLHSNRSNAFSTPSKNSGPFFWPGPHVSPTDRSAKKHRITTTAAQQQSSSSKSGFDPPPVSSLPRPGWLPCPPGSRAGGCYVGASTCGAVDGSVSAGDCGAVDGSVSAGDCGASEASVGGNVEDFVSFGEVVVCGDAGGSARVANASDLPPTHPLLAIGTPSSTVSPASTAAGDCGLLPADLAPSGASLDKVSPKLTPGRSRLAINFSPGSAISHSVI